MGSVIGAVLAWVLEHFFGMKKVSDPAPVQLATTATEASDIAQEEKNSAEITSAAANARANASDSVVRVVSSETDKPDAAVVADVKRQHPDDFRD